MSLSWAVLRARYEDAAFFHRADLAVAPAQLRQRLTGLTIADRLGSMYDQADRIAAVAAELTDLVLRRRGLSLQVVAGAGRNQPGATPRPALRGVSTPQ